MPARHLISRLSQFRRSGRERKLLPRPESMSISSRYTPHLGIRPIQVCTPDPVPTFLTPLRHTFSGSSCAGSTCGGVGLLSDRCHRLTLHAPYAAPVKSSVHPDAVLGLSTAAAVWRNACVPGLVFARGRHRLRSAGSSGTGGNLDPGPWCDLDLAWGRPPPQGPRHRGPQRPLPSPVHWPPLSDIPSIAAERRVRRSARLQTRPWLRSSPGCVPNESPGCA
jgi:hypothetical protein